MEPSRIVTAHLDLPAATADLRRLAIGTVVYLTGRVFTARERAYQHAIEDGAGMPAPKEALGAVNFHCSPAARINADGTYTVGPSPRRRRSASRNGSTTGFGCPPATSSSAKAA